MKKTVALLFGGNSDEHTISITSTHYISEILKSMGFPVECYYFDYENNIFIIEQNDVSIAKTVKNLSTPLELTNFIQLIKDKIVFPINYGKCAEDGKLYAFLELYDIPSIIGGSYKSYALSFDKIFTKYFLNALKIDTPRYKSYSLNFQKKAEIVNDILKTFSTPIIIKPRSNGSSIGVSLVRLLNQFNVEKAIEGAAQYDIDLICEEFVENFREFQVAIIQSKTDFIISKPLEIISKSDFLTYEEKFNSNSTINYLPLAEKDNLIVFAMQEISLKIMKELSLKHFLRVDFLYSPNNNVLYVNEISPMFGMAKESAFWKLWRNSNQNDEITVELILKNFDGIE